MREKMFWEKEKLEEILGVNSTLERQISYISDNLGKNGDCMSREYCREVCPYRFECSDNSEEPI